MPRLRRGGIDPRYRNLPYTYKGETTLIQAVTGDFCPACAESILDATESDRVMKEMRKAADQAATSTDTMPAA